MVESAPELMTAAAVALRTLFGDVPKSRQQEQVVFQGEQAAVLDMLFSAFTAACAAENSFDSVEALNEIVRLTPDKPLLELLENEFFEMLQRRRIDIAYILKAGTVGYEQIEFFRSNFLDIERGIIELRKLPGSKRMNPAVRFCLAGRSILNDPAEKIVELAFMRDPFASGKAYRYINKKFHECNIQPIPTNKFYGFHGVRGIFDEHLQNFAAGNGNVPLLISSLPGLGKTQFSISYTLQQKNLTLIFAEPEVLSGELAGLIEALAFRKRQKFVVFFDDIEPENINWYAFRTNVGGSASLPGNILFVMASNYHYPINILSRGREITFPVFDEIRCTEMVEDFLTDFGLKNANENLASVIGAGYIEDFGQKKFTELSPRTLMRYLEKFKTDAALRKKMLELSRQEMIIKPDAQLFYEFNIKLLRQLYGESYIDELREERLRNI